MIRIPVAAMVMFCGLLSATAVHAAAKSIRSQAVIDLNFDEASGNTVDRATAGKSKDNGVLVRQPRRVPSPFWNQKRGKAVLFNAARKQLVKIADSPDGSRPNAVTVSFFFLNLHPLTDAATHGIVAKRQDTGAGNTNFGINYIGKTDSIRPYINDGSGFRYPDFSLNQVAGSRRLVYLTATFEVADAPFPDDDKDKDDVRIRFYVNGKELQPRKPVRVTVRRNQTWAIDVNPKKLLNTVPIILGATTEKTEHASCLIDEFTLFDRALSPQEVAALFKEVAGPNADQLAAEELKPPTNTAPKITALSQSGLQIGTRTRLTITGRNLAGNPAVQLPINGVKQTVLSGSNAGRVLVELELPKNAAPGFYPLRVQTDGGLSGPAAVAIDHLPQLPAAGSTADKPSQLPGAYSGTIAGAARAQVYFRGKKGQRIVADVEARRLGATVDPVLEIKSHQGTPLVITWGKAEFRGDSRAEVTLPEDGLYYAEFHDLSFKAAGGSPFRLKVGDLKLVDNWYPPAIPADKATPVHAVGTGFRKDAVLVVQPQGTTADRIVPNAAGKTDGPLPFLPISDGREFLEPIDSAKSLPAIDARSDGTPIYINGRLAKSREEDRYLLDVRPGQRLNFKLLGRAIDSPIDAEVIVRALPQKSVLSVQQDAGTSRDPVFNVAVPGNAKQLEVTVRDLYRRGGDHFVYRLRVAPGGQPDFQLAVTAARLNMPAGGTGFVQLQVTRAGYNGPIKLSVAGRDDLALSPASIPARRQGRLFVTVRHTGTSSSNGPGVIRLIGSTTGVKPEVRRVATVADAKRVIPGWESQLTLTIGRPAQYSVAVVRKPAALFKGAIVAAGLELNRPAAMAGYAVRLTLLSNEQPRRKNPRRPQLGNKLLVRHRPGQSISPGADTGRLVILVPLDVAASEIEFVVRADLVPHAYSNRVISTVYSAPFRVPVKAALSLSVDPKSLNLSAGKTGHVRGTIKRTAGFKRPVTVTLSGLPKGYSAKPVIVPADQSTFAIPVTTAKESKLRVIQKVNVTAALALPGAKGRALAPDQVIALKVAP